MEEKKTDRLREQTEDEWDEQDADGAEQATLEELFTELDGILLAMDEKDVSLEDSFALYEKGMKKVRTLNDRLDTVEKQMLVIAADGSEEPLDE